MGESGTDIIIKGGSVELEFNATVFKKEDGDPKIHRSADKKITRIIITGDGQTFDSGEHPEGLKSTIKVVCK